MTDGALTFPPLWPGSTRTTLPLRIPLAVGGNRPGPPLAVARPPAVDRPPGEARPPGVARPPAVDRSLGPGERIGFSAFVLTCGTGESAGWVAACPAGGAAPQADRRTAKAGSAHA